MKRCFGRVYVAGAVLLFGLSSVSAKDDPYNFPLHPKCPSNNSEKILWRDYMAAKMDPVENPLASPHVTDKILRSGDVSIQFREANKIKDPKALPGIDPAACYRIGYVPGQGYLSQRAYNYERHPSLAERQVMTKLPGGPQRGYINVAGTILRYDESGTIFDLRERPIGVMLCYHTNNCEQFKYTDIRPASQPAPYIPSPWREIALGISDDLLHQRGTPAVKERFYNSNFRLPSLLDLRLQAIAEDIDELFERYFKEANLETLDLLEKRCRAGAMYAREYGEPLIPDYAVLGSFWLAITQEKIKQQPGGESKQDQTEALEQLLTDLSDLAPVADPQKPELNYSGIYQVHPGGLHLEETLRRSGT